MYDLPEVAVEEQTYGLQGAGQRGELEKGWEYGLQGVQLGELAEGQEKENGFVEVESVH